MEIVSYQMDKQGNTSFLRRLRISVLWYVIVLHNKHIVPDAMMIPVID